MSAFSIPPAVTEFTHHEAALRAMHGPLTLYVRPQARAIARAPRGGLVFGGWAYLDGEPAVLAEDLDVLVLTIDAPDGGMRTLPRDPRAVLDTLAPYVTRHSTPCAHVAVSIPDDDKPAVLARLIALADHDGITGRETAIFPALEPADWPHRAHVVHIPIADDPAAPIVTFTRDTINGRVYIVPRDLGGVDPRELLAQAVRGLAAAPCELGLILRGVAATVGHELSAERVLDPQFRAALHELLGRDLWIGVPHRFALYAVAVDAPAEDRLAFRTIVEHELARAASQGFAPVARVVLRVVDGRIARVLPLEAVEGIAPVHHEPEPLPPPPAARVHAAAPGLAPGIPHPADLVLVDSPRREINASIVLAGTGAKRLARGIQALGALGATGDRTETPGQMVHCCITLGAIRGWTTRLYLYAFEPDSSTAAAAIARSATAVVVVHGDPTGWPEPTVAAVAHAGSTASAVIGFVGPATGIAALGGVMPAVVAPFDQDAPRRVLKEIVKQVLANLPSA